MMPFTVSKLPRFTILVLVIFAAALGVASPAQAFQKAFWGPASVDGKSQFPIYRDLGVSVFNYTISWNVVAPQRPERPTDPADPAYQWPSAVDDVIREAIQSRMKVAIMLIGAPGWANGGKDWRGAPKSGKDFGDFAEAVSRRYPNVSYWMIWGEPNNGLNFQPVYPLTQEQGTATRLPRRQRAAPRRYAQLVDAAYEAIKRVDRSDAVIGGMTYSGGSIRTYNWVRYLKLPNGERPRMDMWGHNPFGFRKPDFSTPQSSFGVIDFSDLPRLAEFLDQRIRRPDGEPLPLYLSEYTLPSGPEQEFPYYVAPGVQAEWISAALRLSRQYRRIDTFSYIHLYDTPPGSDGQQFVQSGLFDWRGTPKPGYDAFKQG